MYLICLKNIILAVSTLNFTFSESFLWHTGDASVYKIEVFKSSFETKIQFEFLKGWFENFKPGVKEERRSHTSKQI